MSDVLQPPIVMDYFSAIPSLDVNLSGPSDVQNRLKFIECVRSGQAPLNAAYVSKMIGPSNQFNYGYQPVCGLAVFQYPDLPNRHFYQVFTVEGVSDTAQVKAALGTFTDQSLSSEAVAADLRRCDGIMYAMGIIGEAERYLIAGGYPIVVATLRRILKLQRDSFLSLEDTLVTEMIYLRGMKLPQALSQVKFAIHTAIREL